MRLQPIDYGPSILAVLAVIWLVAAATVVVGTRARPTRGVARDGQGQEPEFREP